MPSQDVKGAHIRLEVSVGGLTWYLGVPSQAVTAVQARSEVKVGATVW